MGEASEEGLGEEDAEGEYKSEWLCHIAPIKISISRSAMILIHRNEIEGTRREGSGTVELGKPAGQADWQGARASEKTEKQQGRREETG